MSDAVAAAAAALGRPLTDLGGLGGSDRSGVHRASDGGQTVVVKSYAGGNLESWARERVGLGVAGALGQAPLLLAAPADPPLVVMQDLGDGPSVADHLLAGDPVAADHALVAWATALGRLHARSHAERGTTRLAFVEAVGAVTGPGPSDSFHLGVAGGLDVATRDWAANAEVLGIADPPDITELAGPLTDGDDHHALSPADACPDNNLLTGDGCRLIDFEWAEVRHPAWDAAYLAVPWPTCWCSWRIPTASADRAFAAYCAEAVDGVTHVGSSEFVGEVELARVCWALVSVSWSLAHALRQESTPTSTGPSTRPRIQHRLTLVAESGTSAAGFAAEVLEHTREQWGDLALALAPAYR